MPDPNIKIAEDPNKSKREKNLEDFEARSKKRQSYRLKYYEKRFRQNLKLPSEETAKQIHRQIVKNEPYYKTAMAGPSARMRRIISSPEFEEALVGENPTKEDKEYAEKVSEALAWSMEAVEDTYGYYSTSQAVEGVRQSHQLGVLLKTHGPKGTFYDALKKASKKIEKDVPQKVNGDKNAPKRTMFEDFYDDLYYIDKRLQMGLDLPKMDPESEKKPPRLAVSWEDNTRELLENIPHDPDNKKDHLAKLLVSSYEANIAAYKQHPFSQKKLETLPGSSSLSPFTKRSAKTRKR